MRLPSGKRLGQSDYELVLAVFYSFFLHAAAVFAALLFHFVVIPKTVLPPAYHVKLVGLPESLAPRPSPSEPAPPQKEALPDTVKATPSKKPAETTKKEAPKKSGMPELAPQKPKAAKQEKREAAPAQPATAQPVPAQPATAQPATAPSVTAAGAGAAESMSEGVAVSTTSPQFKFPPYLAIVREKIEQNWNPPPGIKNLKAKVLFTILRSGRVGDAKLEQSSGNFYFDQAAMRAILSSSPFPHLPEGFFQEYEVFSVDLMEKE